MKKEEVLEIIRQNGIGQNIRCYLSSENTRNGKDFMSSINNYKYNNGVIKMYIDRFSFQEHEKNFRQFHNCELLIKEDKNKQSNTIKLFCKFLKIENQLIYVQVLSIKYLDDDKKEITIKNNLGG
jgi:hypothetical protein